MKIIDKTPLQDEKGNISFMARIQGMIKYGTNWFTEVEAQKIAVAMLERGLEKSFILIRNFILPGSDIIIPLILIGLGGVYIIYVTSAKGHFEAKGDQWNTIDNSGNSQPASVNLLERVTRLTRAFQKYLEINKITLPGPVEPIVIAVDPGAHIESMRPIAKVVKSDAIKAFISSLLQAPPIWRNEQIYTLAERIVEPRPPEEPKPEPEPISPAVPSSFSPSNFDESQPVEEFDANKLGFSFEGENAEAQSAAPKSAHPQSVHPRSRSASKPASGKLLGMSTTQVIVLAGMFVLWCCIMVGFGALLYLNQ